MGLVLCASSDHQTHTQSMSAEGMRAVIDQSSVKGPHLLMLIMIADQSKDRAGYFNSEVGYDVLATKCRISVRRAKEIVADLLKWKKLHLIAQGGGDKANWYEIPVRKPYGVGVRESAPVIREEPIREPRALCTVDDPGSELLSQPTPIVSYMKPTKTRRRKA